MNTYSSGNIIRQKVIVEKFCQCSTPISLYSPREDSKGNMYVCSHAGEILKFTDEGDIDVYLTIGGQPNCNKIINKNSKIQKLKEK
jgi:hypothetical protein